VSLVQPRPPHSLRSQPTPSFGIGLRSGLASALFAAPTSCVDFVEIHPENYVGRGGAFARMLDEALERWPVYLHGLSVALASPHAPDREHLTRLRALIRRVNAPWYSDHLCVTSGGNAHTYDLLPIPHTEAWVEVVAARVRMLSDALECPIAMENISTYIDVPGSTMTEAEFLAAVVERSGAKLLLDVNNLYVNARNLGLDSAAWFDVVPLHAVAGIHIAGHEVQPDGLRIDTHGEPVCDDVYSLLTAAVARTGPVPILLERDQHLPPWATLMTELDRVRHHAAVAPEAHVA
jgi:uncharacterized protein (UPF0276 family)